MRRRLKACWIVTVISFFVTGSFIYLSYRTPFNTVQTGRKGARTVTEGSARLHLSKHVTKSLAELGKMPEISSHILFFNRVPKCGSEMLVLLMQWMQGSNNFIHFRLRGGDKRKLNTEEQEELVHEVTHVIRAKAVPLTFDRHMYFVNFTFFDHQSPTFINLIRDPVDKLISRYYYSRITPNPNNPDLGPAPKRKIDHNLVQETLEDCVHFRNTECQFQNGLSYDLTIPYFCGQNPRCMIFNDPWALATAKSNVERYFSVVGVLEELNATLEVLEHELPYFFKGIQNIYFKDLFQPHYNKNRKKPQVTDSVRAHFKTIFVSEYDFYEWAKRRLFQQLQIMYGHNH